MRSLRRFLGKWLRPKEAVAANWERDTPWRQGQIISGTLAAELKLIKSGEAQQKFALVVSHDCDIACALGDEPQIEVIVGTRIDASDQAYTNARDVRILHIEFETPQGKMALELVANDKRAIGKTQFQTYEPDSSFVLPEKELRALRSWLAARYRRAAIPDGLQRLVMGIFRDIFKKGDRPRALDSIYIDFEPDEEELPDGDKYELNVVIVYDTHEPGAKETAEQATDRLIAQFRKKYFIGGIWKSVELRSCVARADTSFTLFDVKNHKLVRLEYLSLRAEVPDETHEE
jgi:hypothetical protein